jgi:hypothetical protein
MNSWFVIYSAAFSFSLVTVLLVVYCYHQSRTLMDPFVILGSLLFFSFSVRPVYQYISDGQIIFISTGLRVSDASFLLAMSWAAVGTLSMFAGVVLRDGLGNVFKGKVLDNRLIAESGIRTHLNNTIFILIGLLSLGFTIYFVYVSYKSIGWLGYRPARINLWGGVELIAKASAPASLVYVTFKRKMDVVFIFLLMISLISGIAATNRNFQFIYVLSVILVYHYRIRNISNVKVVIFATIGFIGTWGAHILKLVVKRGFVNVFGNPLSHAGPIHHFIYGSPLFPFEFLSTYACLRLDGSEKMRWFAMYRFLCIFFIPRSLWEGKPEGLGTTFAGDHELITGRSWPVSIFGDSLMSGGVLLLSVHLLCFGFFSQHLRRRFLSRVGSENGHCMYKGHPGSTFFLYILFCSYIIAIFKNGIYGSIINVSIYFMIILMIMFVGVGNVGKEKAITGRN